MGNIFTRKALNEIMGNEALTPEQRTEQVFGLYGRALDDGYIARAAARQVARNTPFQRGVPTAKLVRRLGFRPRRIGRRG